MIRWVSYGSSTGTGGTGAITPPLPTTCAVNDIFLLFIETPGTTPTISNQNGGTWTYLSGINQSTTTGIHVFWSRYNGTQGNPTVADAGDHTFGVIHGFSGVILTGTPSSAAYTGTEATSDTSLSIPGQTSSGANQMVVAACSRSNDATAANFASWTNASLVSITERFDYGTTQGNGGGIAVAEGIKSTAGAFNATTATLTTASSKAFVLILLLPSTENRIPTTVSMSAAGSFAAASGRRKYAGADLLASDSVSTAVTNISQCSASVVDNVDLSARALRVAYCKATPSEDTSLLVEATVISDTGSKVEMLCYASVSPSATLYRSAKVALSENDSFAAGATREKTASVTVNGMGLLVSGASRSRSVKAAISAASSVVASLSRIMGALVGITVRAICEAVANGSPIRVRFLLNSRAASCRVAERSPTMTLMERSARCSVAERSATVTTRERDATLSVRERAASLLLRKGSS